MNDEPTTAVVQRCLDALQGNAAAEPLIRELLERAVDRLRLLCASLLLRSYPRLTRPPLNLETDELLGGVVAGLLKALREVRPQTVRQFFALANQHMRWQLNDLARLLDEQPLSLIHISEPTRLRRGEKTTNLSRTASRNAASRQSAMMDARRNSQLQRNRLIPGKQ